MLQPKYRIYPSLLDSFQSVLKAREEFESFFNEDSETGEYKRSYEDILAEREKELLDKINRVPHDPIEAADKGTCFNAIVDYLVSGSQTDGVDIKTAYDIDVYGDSNLVQMSAEKNGFSFPFDIEFCKEAAKYFQGCTPQFLTIANLETGKGTVELYGYLDELRADVVYDIKTTKQYTFGKFADHWQRHVYPYCLVKSGMVTEISEFEYTVFVLTGGTSRNHLITGTMYRERYDFDFVESENKLQEMCEQFIDWLEVHREFITDKKIFNYE